MFLLFPVLLLIGTAICQQSGERCVESHYNAEGMCTSPKQCKSAKEDYEVPPASNGKRLSDRKCEEYGRSVFQTQGYIPLLVDPEVITISAPKCDYTGVGLIVGGINADQGEFPHMAAIGWRNEDDEFEFHCSGSLISSRFVLTAGHCTWKAYVQYPEPAVVRMGDQNLDPRVNDNAEPYDVEIKMIHKHPQYAPPSKYNDIALLELARDLDFSSNVRPACLWTAGGLQGHDKALATGWGATDPKSKETSKELQKVSLSLLDGRYCENLLSDKHKNYKNGFISTQLCAGELNGKVDTCQGDSGAPLQVVSRENHCIFHVVGVTSFGRGCAVKGNPGIYTRVSSYLDWIEATVWPGE